MCSRPFASITWVNACKPAWATVIHFLEAIQQISAFVHTRLQLIKVIYQDFTGTTAAYLAQYKRFQSSSWELMKAR